MLRVIKTEFYFDKHEVDWRGYNPREVPSIAFAWFKLDSSDDQNVKSFARKIEIPNFRYNTEWSIPKGPEDALMDYMNFLLLTGGQYYEESPHVDTEFPRIRGSTGPNRTLLEVCLAEKIVIERSPPVEIILKQLLAKSPVIAVGTYAGIAAAGVMPMLMLITIPTGIVVVGTAVGIAKGLEAGLPKAIERFLAPPNRRSLPKE